MRRLRTRSLVAVIALSLSTIGCGAAGSAPPASTPNQPTKAEEPSVPARPSQSSTTSTPASTPIVADPTSQVPGPDTLLGFVAAPVGSATIFAEPDEEAQRIEVDASSPLGAPLTFAVIGDPTEQATRWLQVVLPTRPNGGTAWVRRDAVTISRTALRLTIDRRTRTLTVTDDGAPVLTTAVAVGTTENPTPTGASYVTEVVDTPDPGGAYGPYAIGLALHSDTLTEFGGGPGQVGIHGTDRPDRIGDAVSHGCIRLANEDIEALVGLGLALGTPVLVT